MSKIIKSATLDFNQSETVNVKVFVNQVKESKNDHLLAIANVSIWTEGQKYPQQFNGLQIVEGKEDNLFIVEPSQPSYKRGDEVINGKKWFQMKEAVKADLLARIIKVNESKTKETAKTETTTETPATETKEA